MPNTDLSRFQVSGWDDDLNDIQEEKDPHGIYILYNFISLNSYNCIIFF